MIDIKMLIVYIETTYFTFITKYALNYFLGNMRFFMDHGLCCFSPGIPLLNTIIKK